MATSSITKVTKADLHESRPTWWLRSLFHFSFANWQPDEDSRYNFGALRVVNDDVVQPRAGFGRHGHRDAEIFSYVLDGELTHADSMGNRESLPRGSVQYMSAGTGVQHSEMNDGDVPTRFLQIWILPDRRGHTPQYGSSRYTKEDRHNRLLHILGGTKKAPAWENVNAPQSIHLHQDANVYVSESDPGTAFKLSLGAARQAYLISIEGSLEVNNILLDRHEAAKIVSPPDAATPLTITAGTKGSHFLLIEMAQPL